MPSTTRSLVFPIKGLHESAGFDIQPPQTTTDGLNVRTYDQLAGRARGGRRGGTRKYTYQPLTESERPVQKLIKAVEGAEYQPPYETITEDWQSYAAEVQPDLSPTWGMACILDEDSPSLEVYPDTWETTANGLEWRNDDYGGSNAFLAQFIPLMYDAEPNVTVTLRAKPDITSGSGDFGGADEPTWVGPFVRASVDLQTGYFACLTPASVASNTVILAIYRMDPVGSSGYVRVANETITLDGGSSITTDCQISLWVYREVGTVTTLRARLVWPGGGASGADLDTTIEYVDSDTSTGTNQTLGQYGAGVGIFNPSTASSSNPSFTEGTAFRTISSVTARPRTPVTRPVIAKWSATDNGLNRYHRPRGIVSVADSRASGVSTGRFTVGSDGYDSDSASGFVCDTDNDAFRDAGTSSITSVGLARPWDASGPHDMEVVLSIPSDMGTSSDGALMFTFRASASTGDFVSVVLSTTIDTTDSRGHTGRINFAKVDLQGPDGTLMNDTSPDFLDVMYVEGSVLRAEDRGDSFNIYLDGRLIISYSAPQINFSTSAEFGFPEDAEDTYAMFTQFSNIGVGYRNLVSEIRWVRRSTNQYNDAGKTTAGRLLGVSGGTIADCTTGLVSSIATGIDALNDGLFNIQAAAAFNSVFFADGENIKQYSLSTNTVVTPTPSDGSFPTGPRLVCLYRGRLVWSGTVADPHNWFMSAVNSNGLDYNYSPTTPSETQAVAGNNSTAGLIGDVITTLIPFGDDYLLFGCDHSIWKMSGDPAAGGVIDLVTDKIGMAFGSAWAKDPSGTTYFWGTEGIYRMTLDSIPQNMTKNRIDLRLQSVSLDRNRIFMEWDVVTASLIVLVQPSDPSEDVRVFVWESRADAWWEDSYPTTHGPNCLLSYDSTAPDDAAFLMGGRDGYVRQVDRLAADDDGESINSRVRLPMFIAPDMTSEVVLNSIQPVLANGSSPVTVSIYSGQSAQGCAEATAPRAAALLAHAGRGRTIRRPVRGFAVQAELSSTASTYPWAVESMTAVFDASGLPVRHARTTGEGAAGGS